MSDARDRLKAMLTAASVIPGGPAKLMQVPVAEVEKVIEESGRLETLYAEASTSALHYSSAEQSARAGASAALRQVGHARAERDASRASLRKANDTIAELRAAPPRPSEAFDVEQHLIDCAAALAAQQEATTADWDRRQERERERLAECPPVGVLVVQSYRSADEPLLPVWVAMDANGRPLLAGVLTARANVLAALARLVRQSQEHCPGCEC